MVRTKQSSLPLTEIILLIPALMLSVAILDACSPGGRIARQAERQLLKDSAISQGHIGISIYEPSTRKYWYNHHADKYFIPSSNTKLFTLYAGLKFLGDSLPGIGYRFIPDSNITCLYPTGDPSFLDPRFTRQPVFDFLKSQTRIRIEKPAPVKSYGMGWAWDDYTDDYMLPRSALPMYGNVITINWTSADQLNIRPSWFSRDADRPSSLPNGFTLNRRFGDNHLVITDGRSKRAVTPFETDWATVAGLLQDTLPQLKEISFGNGRELDYTIIGSRPPDSLFRPMMIESDNYYAEQTLLMVSRALLGRMDEGAVIDTLLKTTLKAIPQKPKWVDGSGLSRYNLFTPQSFIYILNRLGEDFGKERIFRILPTGGEGTLKRLYLKDSGYIYAKTGTLSNNCALSGFLTTKGGKSLIFSILVNNYQTAATPVRKAIEQYLMWLRENY